MATQTIRTITTPAGWMTGDSIHTDGRGTADTADVAPPSLVTHYVMMADHLGSPLFWDVADAPDWTGASSGVNPGDLSDIVLIRTYQV